ncbi:hypothetical protein BJ508DRAFT_127425 [Ascobolus immersus RN42]|uniref:Secreted protein n=1 Tax=Ascobolus immersus RN42 TaxID=1160509 RepID=A0A3N4I907_ASCIM|nr:hypothetical protein BJ508DRAFT_127425 [Ascobolus immersus RN42]
MKSFPSIFFPSFLLLCVLFLLTAKLLRCNWKQLDFNCWISQDRVTQRYDSFGPSGTLDLFLQATSSESHLTSLLFLAFLERSNKSTPPKP